MLMARKRYFMKDSENKDEKTISNEKKGNKREGLKCKSLSYSRKKKAKNDRSKFLILFQKLISKTGTIKYKTLNLLFLGISRFIDGTIIFSTFFFLPLNAEECIKIDIKCVAH